MILFSVLIGLFLIGIGFLIKAYPDTMAGYNTMPVEKKKNVDIVGLTTFVKKGCIIIGITMMVLSVFFKFFHFKVQYSIWAIMFVYFAGIIILVIKVQKFNGKRKTA